MTFWEERSAALESELATVTGSLSDAWHLLAAVITGYRPVGAEKLAEHLADFDIDDSAVLRAMAVLGADSESVMRADLDVLQWHAFSREQRDGWAAGAVSALGIDGDEAYQSAISNTEAGRGPLALPRTPRGRPTWAGPSVNASRSRALSRAWLARSSAVTEEENDIAEQRS